jgi:hypothetical protein
MFHSICFSLILIFSILFKPTQAGWVLVWEDEFNGGNLADRWDFELGCSGMKILN